jgi:hypothetical protein
LSTANDVATVVLESPTAVLVVLSASRILEYPVD